MRWILALAFVGLVACGDESFENPPQPDLYKVPYDFSIPLPDGFVPRDLSVPDLGGAKDMKPADDLSSTD